MECHIFHIECIKFHIEYLKFHIEYLIFYIEYVNINMNNDKFMVVELKLNLIKGVDNG